MRFARSFFFATASWPEYVARLAETRIVLSDLVEVVCMLLPVHAARDDCTAGSLHDILATAQEALSS